jgi:Ulp1 protease family, C-terminal catalytic domain
MKCHTIIVPVHQVRAQHGSSLACNTDSEDRLSAQEMHWVLAVIDMKKREVKYLDSLKGVDRMCLVRGGACAIGVLLHLPSPL